MNLPQRHGVLLALGLFSGAALADEDELTKLRQRVEQLESLVRDLVSERESRAAAPAVQSPSAAPAPNASAPASAAPATGAATVAAPSNGTAPVAAQSARSNGSAAPDVAAIANGESDLGLRVQLHGDLQIDGRYYQGGRWPSAAGSAIGTPDTFLLRRARPILEATVLEHIDFRVMPDFGGGNTTLYDAYGEARIAPWARIRLGKFKPPIGLEALQLDDVLAFSERSLANDMVPIRDVGVQLAGDLFDGRVQYQVGVFNGALSGTAGGDRATNSSKDIDERVFFQPFNGQPGVMKGLGFGISHTGGRPEGNATTGLLPTYVSSGQQAIFAYNTGAFANGSHQRLSPQGYYYLGPLGVMAEYVSTQQSVTRATNHRDLEHRGWEVTVGYVLTGEDRTYNGVEPEHAAWRGGYGAFELVARTARLKIDPDAFVGTAATRLADPATSAYEVTDYGLGLNWYLTRLIRVNFSYDKNTFKGLVGFTRPTEQVFIGRFQVAF